ncbi:mucin-17-like [Dorcoceras hygrometricum]|uniref:Mucin-17-like n=1 Tax=Dorcoceras hygrometricum TaxID=472368 RepID=A0A2Z6ZW23_9LAMI|nr:mucin-17-like [Dorcoceras hygrometricum]
MAGLAMETSKAEPADRNQAKAKLNRDAYVDNFPYVESYVDSNPYVESSVNRFAYVESSCTHCFSSEENMYQP